LLALPIWEEPDSGLASLVRARVHYIPLPHVYKERFRMGVPRLMPQHPFSTCVVLAPEERRRPFCGYTQRSPRVDGQTISPGWTCWWATGASCAIWRRFRYTSLYEQSRSQEIANRLRASTIQVSKKLDTTDFELIPSAPRTASLVVGAMGQDPAASDELSSVTQNALAAVVNSVDPTLGPNSGANLRAIKKELLRYNTVYSTNYDLLNIGPSCWMDQPDLRITSLHRNSTPAMRRSGGTTKVLFLHGARHLFVASLGGDLARSACRGRSRPVR
jgi:hypothetical protein